jgi:O-antigen/teichoic acid export membrane protein
MLSSSATKTALRIAGNTMSVLTSDVLNRATTFLIYALVSRHLDTRAFGQLSLALAFFYMFQVFAVLGLPVLVTREVAKNKQNTAAYLANGGLLALGGGLVSILAMAAFVWMMHYDADTAALILLFAVGLLPYAAAALCEAIFRGWERMDYIAYANVPVSIGKVVLAYVLLRRGSGLWAIAWVLAASPFMVLAIQALLVRRCTAGRKWIVEWGFARRLAQKSFTFFGIDSLIAIGASLNIVLISKMVDVRAVAAFNAASQLLVPLAVFSQGVATCVFPLLCRKFDSLERSETPAPGSLQQVADRLIEVLLMVAVPGAVVLFFSAGPVLALVYGNRDFLQAAILLRIMVLSVVLRALTSALGNVLLAGLKERVTLRIVAVDLLAGLVLGYGLIHQFGVLGAAVATTLTRLVDFIQHYAPAKRLVPQLAIGKLAWPCTAATIAMSAALLGLKSSGLVPTLIASGAVYLLVLSLLLPFAHGYFRRSLLASAEGVATVESPVDTRTFDGEINQYIPLTNGVPKV